MRSIALDQNHWIYLARTYHGKQRGAPGEILDRLLAAVRTGEARVPLSFLHLVEVLKHEKAGRRNRLAEVFDALADGWFFATWGYVLPQEIDRAVAQMLGATPPPPPEAIGRGFLFGLSPEARASLEQHLRPGSFEKIERIAALPGAVLDLISSSKPVERAIQNASIARRNFADVTGAENARRLVRTESRELRHRVQLANYTLHFQDKLARSLAHHGVSLQDFCSRGVEFLVDFWSRIPSLHVDCELSLYRDRQWSRPVQPNDFADLGYMVLAIPYCSVVVAERFWARAASETKVASRYGTTVLPRLVDLQNVLAA